MLKHLRLFIIPIYALLGIALVVFSGFPEAQLAALKPPQPYPVQGVLFSVQSIIFEAIFIFLILRPRSYSKSWGRALVAFVAAVAQLSFWRMGLMHAPSYYSTHVNWVAVGTVFLFMLLVVSIFSNFKTAPVTNHDAPTDN